MIIFLSSAPALGHHVLSYLAAFQRDFAHTIVTLVMQNLRSREIRKRYRVNLKRWNEPNTD